MTLLYVVLATLLGGVASVLIAASLTASLLERVVKRLVSFSVGVLLGTALLHVLPEAFESHADPRALFLTLLAALMFFFLLEKAELYRHSHHHEGDDPHHDHHHGFDAEQAGRGEGGDLGFEIGDQRPCLDAGQGRDVVDRLFRIERRALPADLAEGVDQHAAQLEHAQFKDGEQPGGAGADDGDIGFDVRGHGTHRPQSRARWNGGADRDRLW